MSLQSFPPWMRPIVPAVSFFGGVTLWLAAPAILGLGAVAFALGGEGVFAAAGGGAFAGLFLWAAVVYVLSAVLWSWWTEQMGAPFWYGFFYPLGALVGSFIFLRAWVRGRNVEWKGRRYRLRPISERA